MKNKVVINLCYGGFSISLEAAKLMNLEISEFDKKYGTVHWYGTRHDPVLVKTVEALGSEAASGEYAKLLIIKIPGNKYQLNEHDGMEWVETPENIEWIKIK